MHLLNKIAQRKVVRIHHAFDTAAERLLEEARSIIANTRAVEGQRHSDLVSQAEILKHIGFVNSKNVIIADALHNKYKESVSTKIQARGIEQLVLDYQHHFPFHKFLTIDQLLHICMKYNLVFHPVEQYIGEIPTKNVKEMVNIPDLNKNPVVTRPGYSTGGPTMQTTDPHLDFGTPPKYFVTVSNMPNRSNNHDDRKLMNNKRIAISYDDYKYLASERDEYKRRRLATICDGLSTYKGSDYQAFFGSKMDLEVKDSSKFYIAAPATEFDLNKSLLPSPSKILKIQMDPVVFRLCKGGIQVITKWGLEASDPLLVNNIEN